MKKYKEAWMPDYSGRPFRCYLINGIWMDADLIDIVEGRK